MIQDPQTVLTLRGIRLECPGELPLLEAACGCSCHRANQINEVVGCSETWGNLWTVLFQSGEVGEGTSCELYDCYVAGSIKLCKGASAKLVRTHIRAAHLNNESPAIFTPCPPCNLKRHNSILPFPCAPKGSPAAGVAGRAFDSLSMVSCTVTDCATLPQNDMLLEHLGTKYQSPCGEVGSL